ncbi:phage replisome organizer N-terminal domain-containing protein [Pseudalkalibacillus sp. R45]|uniref:phage replisome organizer N-terminal domain-containing protein n=1 Tax=Pseudalkalibacillus sp. R45 TaxID=3457433 RepID=UPI003FCDFC60
MSEVKWIKLSTQMFEDEKIRLIECMPESDALLIIWIKLLTQAGKTNANGYIYLNKTIPYTDEMLATIFNRPLNIVRLALKTFEEFGMIEIKDDHFITISNWEKHQNVEGLDKIRKQTRDRVAKHREKKRLESRNGVCNVTVTDGNATDIEEELEKEIDIKKYKKENQTKKKSKNNQIPYDLYKQKIGKANTEIKKEIEVWVKVLNEELVIEALNRSIQTKRPSWNYSRAILTNWVRSNVQNLNDVEVLDLEFSNNRKEDNDGKPSGNHHEESSGEAFSITGGQTGRVNSRES